jgi:hypothetical protein
MTTASNNIPQPAGRTQVKRQITLPLSKAVEIAYKNIRMRLSRSLLVTSGIVLALAFLMSILTNDAFIGAIRGWAAEAPSQEWYRQLGTRRAELEQQIAPLADRLRSAALSKPAVPAGTPLINAEKEFGKDLPDLLKEFRQLPGTPDNLRKALTADASLVPVMKDWIALTREMEKVREQQIAPQKLETLMREQGVSTSPEEIENNRIQTRWLIGLALLVAFVGILNAMLMSVTERFREIGTMKCLGALDGFIIKLFLLESLFQGIVGTLIGITAGLLLSVAAVFSTYGGYAWTTPWADIGIAAAICFAVGVGLTVAGAVYPAWQAARMQPIEAMRAET